MSELFKIRSSEPSSLIIGTNGNALVTINLKDGSITYGPNYTPDAAAKVFWTAMSSEYKEFMKWKNEHRS